MPRTPKKHPCPALPPCPEGTLLHRVPELRDLGRPQVFNLSSLTVSSRLQPRPELAPLLP